MGTHVNRTLISRVYDKHRKHRKHHKEDVHHEGYESHDGHDGHDGSALSRCQEILALTGADAAQGLDPTPFGQAGLKSFRAGTDVTPRKKENDSGSPQPCEVEEALRCTGVRGLDLHQAMADGWPMDSMGLAVERAPDLSGLELEELAVRQGGEDEADLLAPDMETARYPPLPTGTGISRYLCKEASLESGESISLPLVVLMHFCGEGDNTPHAITMADVVNSSLKLFSEGDDMGSSPSGGRVRWTSPLSWASLYGPPPEADAYL